MRSGEALFNNGVSDGAARHQLALDDEACATTERRQSQQPH